MMNTHDEVINESALKMEREKPRSFFISLTYLLTRILRPLVGDEALLRFYTNAAWLFSRMAFEFAGEVYEGEFHNQAKALNENFLQKWIGRNDSVLDIGCGVGRWCLIAAKHSGKVTGIDYDEDLIDEAREQEGAGGVEFVVGDVTRDLAGRRFDVGLLIHVIEHIENADEMLSDLREACFRLIIEVPDFENDPLNWVRIRQGYPFYTDGDHVREYTERILTDQLTRNGWHVLEMRKHGGSILVVAGLEEK